MNNNYKYIIAILAGFTLALLLIRGCNPPKSTIAEDNIKIDTIYQIKTDTIKLTDYKPKLKYIYRTKSDTIEIPIDTMKFWKYQYDSIHQHKKGNTHLKIKGWGSIDNIEMNTTVIDTTIYITKEITKYKSTKGIYFSPEYLTHFNKDINQPIYKVNLDYVNNNWIIGTGIGLQNNEQIYSFKVGFKIR